MSVNPREEPLFPFDPDSEGAFDEQLSLPLPGIEVPAPFNAIVKRNGQEEAFRKDKIAGAIFKAAQSVGGSDRDLAQSLASAVTIYLAKRLFGKAPTVDQVHDAVERVLIHMSHARTALAYARYRDRKARIRRLRSGDMRALMNELEEARQVREALGGDGDSALFVRTSADAMITWDRDKIVDALVRETGLERAVAVLIAVEVEHQIHRADLKTLTTSLVRELVGAKLVEHGLDDIRERHRRLGVPLYDTQHILRGVTPESMNGDPAWTDQILARRVKKEFALAQVFSANVTEAHLRGSIHLHHLPEIDRLHSARHGLSRLLARGIVLPGGEVFAEPPRSADNLLAQMVKFTEMLQAYFSEAVVWDAVNVFFAPYVHGLHENDLAEFAQLLIYEFAYRGLANGTDEPVGLGIHWNIPESLAGLSLPTHDPLAEGKTLGDFAHTAQQLAWAMLNVFNEARNDGLRLAAPLIHCNLDDAFFRAPGHEAFLQHVSLLASMRDNVRFHHTLSGDDTSESWRAARQPVLHQVTLNLPRAAYEAGTERALYEELDKLLLVAVDAHRDKFDFVEGLMDSVASGPLALLNQKWHDTPYIDLNAAAAVVALDGLHECVAVLVNSADGYSTEGIAFAERILAHLKDGCARLALDSGLRLVLGANTSTGVSRRFATLDAEQFPRTAQTVIQTDPEDKSLFYSTGCAAPLGGDRTPMERARLEGLLVPHLAWHGETRVVLPPGETRPEAIADFVRIAFTRTGCRSLMFL